jgi:hypothetical protein
MYPIVPTEEQPHMKNTYRIKRTYLVEQWVYVEATNEDKAHEAEEEMDFVREDSPDIVRYYESSRPLRVDP